MLSVSDVRQALSQVVDPELGKDIVSLGMVREVNVAEDVVRITIALTTMQCPLKQQIVDDVRARVASLNGAPEVQVTLTEMTPEERARLAGGKDRKQEGMAAHLNQVRHVLAIMSGKGGVGKSLVTSLLAAELRRRDLRVGILDADITGPSIPKMFGLTERPQSTPIGISPVLSRTGIRVMSVNLLLPREDEAVIWRGPLIAGAIKQFWGMSSGPHWITYWWISHRARRMRH